MGFDSRLRDDLQDKARSLPNDIDTALSAVRRQAARRQRSRLVIAGTVVFVLLAVVGVSASKGLIRSTDEPPQPSGPSTTTHQSVPTGRVQAGGGDPLTGEWQSAPLPAQRFRAAISAAGIGPTTATQVISGTRTWVVQLTFDTTLTVETWDPADPSASLRLSTHYAVRLLPRHRLVFTAFDASRRWYFSYQLSGNRLLLRYIAAWPESSDGLETARFAAWAAAPTTRVHY